MFIGKVGAVLLVKLILPNYLCRHNCVLRQRVGEIDSSKKTEQKVTNKQRKKNKRALVTVCRARYYANVPGGVRINIRKRFDLFEWIYNLS